MMPALWMTTFSAGWSLTSRSTPAVMAAGSVRSSTADAMPGFAAATSSKTVLRRPVMITRLPRA